MKKLKWYFIISIPLICLGFLYKKSLKKPLEGNFDRNFANYSLEIIDSLHLRTDVFSMQLSQNKIYINDGASIRIL